VALNYVSTLKAQCHYPIPLQCNAWPKPLVLGTFNHFNHIILANEGLFQAELYPNCTNGVLLRNFARLFGDAPPPLSEGALMTFIEADLAGNVLFPNGVKLLVADAVELFGTDLGVQMQTLCIKWGWVLAWSLQPDLKVEYISQRIADPTVLVHTRANATVDPDTQAAFGRVWREANATKAATGWEGLWSAIKGTVPKRLQLRPSRAVDCSNSDCIGADAAGDCLCYASS
jgi:hypothetical protein